MDRILIFLLSLLLCHLNMQAQQGSYESQLPDTFNSKNTGHYTGLAALYVSDPEKAEIGRYIINKGIEKGKKENNDTLVILMNYYLADYYFYKEDYSNAIDLYMKVLPLFKEQCDTLMTAKTLTSIGLIYRYRNDNENTLKYYFESYKLLNETRQKSKKIETEKVIILTNIINQYRTTKQYQKIIEQSEPAITFAQEIGDSLRLASILNIVGVAYKNLNQIDRSLSTFFRAEKIFDYLNDDFRKAYIYINIGGLYDKVNQQDSAFHYYTKALGIFQKEDYVYGQLHAQTGIAAVYVAQKHDNEARELYRTSIDSAQAYGFNEIVLESYAALSSLEYRAGNYKTAYDYNEHYYSLYDSLNTIDKDHQYAELQTRYETVQKENEINLLRSEKLIKENELRKNKLFNWIAFTVVLILLGFLYVGFVFYNQKKKANALLTEKNSQIEAKNQQLSQMNQQIVSINQKLEQSQVELTTAIKSKDRFFTILGHDLRNPFHCIMGQSYLLSKSYDKLSVDERKKYAIDIYQSCEQVNRLLENLLDWNQSQSGRITYNPQRFELHKAVSNAVAALQNNANEKSITIETLIDNSIITTADLPMLETVIRNLLNNGIKFTPQGGNIKITASLSDKKLTVSVSDNGVGIPSENLDKLFTIDTNIKTRGTNNERGTGLGLVICKEFIKLHNGEIWAESSPGKGSTIYFSIPTR